MDIPVEMFALFMGASIAFAVFGFVRKPQIPAMLAFAGVFILVLSVSTTNIVMGYNNNIDFITTEGGISGVTVDTILFSDDYTTNTGWTQVGTLVTVDSATPDKADFASATDGSDRRVHKSLGVTITTGDLWRLESTFARQASTNIPTHVIYALTAGTGNPKTATQDAVAIFYGTGAYAGAGDCFAVAQKEGSEFMSPIIAQEICSSANQDYYIRLDKLSETEYELGVFSNAGRTTHITGSPTRVVLDSTLTGLTTIQHSVDSTGAVGRTLDGTIDDTALYSISVSEDIIETYDYSGIEPINHEFTELEKTLFALLGSIMILTSALMLGVNRE